MTSETYSDASVAAAQHPDNAARNTLVINLLLVSAFVVMLNETMRCTALGGAIVNVGRLGGIKAEIDLNLHAVRRIRLVGATFRTRSLQEHADVVRKFLTDHGQALADGSLAPLIDSVFPFADLPAAIQRSMQRGQLGKIVIEQGN